MSQHYERKEPERVGAGVPDCGACHVPLDSLSRRAQSSALCEGSFRLRAALAEVCDEMRAQVAGIIARAVDEARLAATEERKPST